MAGNILISGVWRHRQRGGGACLCVCYHNSDAMQRHEDVCLTHYIILYLYYIISSFCDDHCGHYNDYSGRYTRPLWTFEKSITSAVAVQKTKVNVNRFYNGYSSFYNDHCGHYTFYKRSQWSCITTTVAVIPFRKRPHWPSTILHTTTVVVCNDHSGHHSNY